MTEAVIVSTARTGLAKSWKGAFNMTHGATLGGHVIEHAIQRAGIERIVHGMEPCLQFGERAPPWGAACTVHETNVPKI